MTSLQIVCVTLGHIRFGDLRCVVCGDAPRPVAPPGVIVVRRRR